MDYETVIGLEVHAELKTNSKIFCGCTTAYGGDPNTMSAGMFGLARRAAGGQPQVIEFAMKAGLALNCGSPGSASLTAKTTTTPDLPKNYQISQYDLPIATGGRLEIEVNGEQKTIGVTRVHMEEDAGKLQHLGNYSLVDYNRTGVPLLEIVSEPDMRTPEEAKSYRKP
jgi:aspartyl-tRNA(Asn)/glutamyl-tRNA(Gln) amidotransferase subunit B